MWALGIALALGAGLVGCQREQAGGDPQAALVERGRRVYRGNCAACHHFDPGREGSVGPAVAGASLELLEARVLRAEYPPGYVPKRPSRLMPAQPFLRADLPALAAYLAQVSEGP
jgi:mono/diheme cytochrome c family protein